MADSKISALPASTTPLAGTEVLPIVQGGQTRQVTVADLTAGRAVSALSLTLTNALAATSGGTGQSSYAVGDLLYASSTTALSKLADVATGSALISGGVGVAPSWGKIGLTTHVSGTLAVGNGGTGNTSFGAGYVIYGDSTNPLATSSNLVYNSASNYFGIGTAGSPGKNLDIATATATAARLRTTTAASGTGTLLFEIGNNFSGISQSFVQGIGPGNSGVSQLSFGVSITAGATTATDVARFDTGGNFRPSADNTYSNGTGALRWSVIYAATGTINTSDGTTKTVLGSASDAEKRVAQRIKSGLVKFKFNDAVAAKGDAARIHWGVVAQDVRDAFQAEGLEAEQYGLFCSDTWFEKDGEKVLDEYGEIMQSGECPAGATKITQLGVRYEELLAFMIAGM